MKLRITEQQLRFIIESHEIYEVNIDYLTPDKLYTPSRLSKIKQELGKVFKEDLSYGLKFQKLNQVGEESVYKVIFPNNFFNKYFSEYKVRPEKPKTIKKYIDTLDDTQYTDWVKELSVDQILTDSIKIERGHLNRIHTTGIPPELRGIGLGYIIYKEFIKEIGWASSNETASNLAVNVWSKIISDNDFIPIVIKTSEKGKLLEIPIVFWKKWKVDVSQKIIDIIEKLTKYLDEEGGLITEIEIDDNTLKNKVIQLLSKNTILKDYKDKIK